MFKDVIVPSKVGHYFLFSKRIVSLDITQYAVRALVIHCKGKHVRVTSSISIALKDFSNQAVVNAIKKIISKVGKYDEVVTSLSTSTIVFKELELPFIGRDKIEMVVPYEVESLLPFALDQAVIDFMIIHEDQKAQKSKIIVAAALKSDVDAVMLLCEKAAIKPSVITIDMFALYTMYYNGIYTSKEPRVKLSNIVADENQHGKNGADEDAKSLKKKVKESARRQHIDVLIDVGFEATKMLYMNQGSLHFVRTLPVGISDIIQAVGKRLELSYYDLVQDIIGSQEATYKEEVDKELFGFFGEISKTISFFERQMRGNSQKPDQIIVSGLGCNVAGFVEYAKSFFDVPVHEVDIKSVTKRMGIKVSKHEVVSSDQFANMSVGLFAAQEDEINLLKGLTHKADTILFYQQMFMIILLTIMTIGGVYWMSSTELQKWDRAYIAYKKDLITTIEQKMKVDLKSEKNLKNIVQKAEDTLKKRHKLWFSFSKQTEQSYLEYLQELSTAIDRDSLGLNLRKMRLDAEKVSMAGSVKDFEALEVFEEELMGLKRLALVDKPRETTFSIELKVKDKDKDQQ